MREQINALYALRATMNNPKCLARPSSAFQWCVSLSMRNTIDRFESKCTGWEAVLSRKVCPSVQD